MNHSSISSISIQKLGHEIYEIRVRALQNLLSKFELGITFDNEIPRSMELLENLINWFDLEPLTEEKQVLDLLQKLLNSQTGTSLIKYKGSKSLIQDLKSIKLKLSESFHNVLNQLMDQIEKIDSNFDVVPPLVSDLPLSYRSGDSIPFQVSSTSKSGETLSASRSQGGVDSSKEQLAQSSSQRQGILKSNSALDSAMGQSKVSYDKQIRFSNPILSVQIDGTSTSNESGQTSYVENTERDTGRSLKSDDTSSTQSIILINTFPPQPLTASDRQILNSLENSLTFTTNEKPQELLNSLKFLREVALKDFPPEIFLQETNILPTLYNIIETSTSTRLSTSTLECLLKISNQLHERILTLTEPSLKKTLPPPNYEDTKKMPLPIFAMQCLTFMLRFILEKRHSFENDTTRKKLTPTINVALNLIDSLCDLITLSIAPLKLNPILLQEEKKIHDTLLSLFENFAQTLDQLKIITQINETYIMRLAQISILISLIKIVHLVKVPKSLRMTFNSFLDDTAFAKMFPHYHEVLKEYCDQKKSDDVKGVTNAMTASVQILRNDITFLERINIEDLFLIIWKSIPALEFHKNFKVIDIFFALCLKMGVDKLNSVQNYINDIFISLLSHNDRDVSNATYTKVHQLVKNRLGLNYVKKTIGHENEYENDLIFFVQSKILKEILEGVLNDISDKAVSEDILLLILKGKAFVSEATWGASYMPHLVSVFSLLCLCVNSPFGKAIVKMFDPDVSVTLAVPKVETVKANLRFLFTENVALRKEAVGRLLWLLTTEPDYVKMTPKIKTLDNEHLQDVFQNQTVDFTKRNFECVYQMSNLVQVIELLTSSTVDFDLFKSALTQVSVMVADVTVQKTFIEQGGVDIVLRALNEALHENNIKQEILKPCIVILKNLTIQNPVLREELSYNSPLFFNLLRTLLITHDKFTLNEISSLFVLLLFSNLIVPSAKGLAFPSYLSVIKTLKCNIYKKTTPIMERSTSFWKALRIHWNIEYFGGVNEIFDEKSASGFALPFDFDSKLKLLQGDRSNLKTTSIEFALRDFLIQIQNATSHTDAMEALHNMEGYLTLLSHLKVDDHLTGRVRALPWKETLARFVDAPSNGDYEILREIFKVLSVFFIFDTNTIFVDVKNFLHDDEVNVEFFDFLGRFIEEGGDGNVGGIKYVFAVVRDNLRGRGAQFYDLNYLNGMLNCLKELTGSEDWSKVFGKKEFDDIVSGLIDGSWEILNVFNRETESSFMGVNVTRCSLTILNQIISEIQTRKKSLESIWFDRVDSFNCDRLLNLLKSTDVFVRNGVLGLISGLVMSARGATVIVMDSHRAIWNIALEVLLDKDECSMVRESAAVLLTNLSSHANLAQKNEFNLPLAHAAPNYRNDVLPNNTLFYLLEDFSFYENLNLILLQLYYDCEKNEKCLGVMSSQDHLSHFTNLNDFKEREGLVLPNLIKHTALFINNLICLDAEKVCEILHEHQIVRNYFRCLHFPPLVTKSNHSTMLYADVIEMNSAVCLLLTRCATNCNKCRTICINTKDCLNVLIGLLNPEIYDDIQPNNLNLRNKLYSEIFLLLSVLLHSDTKNHETEILFNPKNHHFIKALSISLDASKNNSQLQRNALKFLTNLFPMKISNPNDTYENFLDKKNSSNSSTTFGSVLTKNLINLYKIEYYNVINKDVKKKELILGGLSVLLCVSQTAKSSACEEYIIKEIRGNLLALNLELSLHSLESLRMSEKKKVNPLLKELDLTLSLLNNLALNCNEVKSELVDSADISDQLHKFFFWISLDRNILMNALCLVNTLTSGNERVCLSLILTTANFGSGPKKTPTSFSLLSVVCETVMKELKNVSKVRDLTVFELAIQILGNVCCVSECRSVLAKQMGLFQSFLRIHPQMTKNQKPWDQIERLILNFLKTFTFYPEGQVLVGGRKTELFELILSLANCSKIQQHKLLALQIIRHVAFHNGNRIILLSSMEFLHLAKTKLNNAAWEEKHAIITTLWALCANNQRSKNVIRCSGIDSILQDLIKQEYIKSQENLSDLEQPIQEAIYLLKMLRDGSLIED